MRAGSGRTTATEIMICESFGMGKHLARGTSAKPFSPSACHTACVQNTMARGLLASSHSPRTHLDARAPTATPERSETQLRQDDATTEPRLSAYKADEDVDHTLRLHSRTNRYTTPTSLQLLMPLFTPTRMALQIQKHPIIKLPRGGWVAPAPPPWHNSLPRTKCNSRNQFPPIQLGQVSQIHCAAPLCRRRVAGQLLHSTRFPVPRGRSTLHFLQQPYCRLALQTPESGQLDRAVPSPGDSGRFFPNPARPRASSTRCPRWHTSLAHTANHLNVCRDRACLALDVSDF